MELILHIPDEIASRIGGSGDLSRRALEVILAEVQVGPSE
jgi:hypothetical protein